jgi:hypothetical protein
MLENTIQKTCVSAFRVLYPTSKLVASQNGISLQGLSAKQRTAVVNEEKAMGMEVGCADLTAYLPNGKCVHIEMKTETGTQSDKQKMYQEDIEAIGHKYYVVRDFNSFFNVIIENTSTEYRSGLYTSAIASFKQNGKLLHFGSDTEMCVIEAFLNTVYGVVG